jgi:hypothetical protein
MKRVKKYSNAICFIAQVKNQGSYKVLTFSFFLRKLSCLEISLKTIRIYMEENIQELATNLEGRILHMWRYL